jgi:hypothetical protein
MAHRKNNADEAEWRIFRECVPQWRERYLRGRNKEILAILKDKNRTSTEQFWDAYHRMQEEAEILTTCLDGHSRSKMRGCLILMYRHGLVVDKDLEQFRFEGNEGPANATGT